MTSHATFGFYRRVFISKWALLIGVTFYAGCITARCQSGLFQFEATVRIVAVATLHHPFQNLMMERLGEIRFRFIMATHAELRLAHPQHSDA